MKKTLKGSLVQVVISSAVSLSFTPSSASSYRDEGTSVCSDSNVCVIQSGEPSADAVTTKQAAPLGFTKQKSQSKAFSPKAGPEKKNSNLPAEYQSTDWNGFSASDKAVLVSAQVGAKVPDIRAGDILKAVFEHEIEVWPGVEAPVRAAVTAGPYRGAFAFGSAKLDQARKRVLVEFSRLRLNSGQTGRSVLFKGAAAEVSGKLGLGGEYHSESGKFFVAQMLASAAAGFTDSTVQRQQNSLGNWVQEPSLENSAKTGAATAMAKRAERWAQQESQAPEWTETKPFQEILIFIQTDPTEDTQ